MKIKIIKFVLFSIMLMALFPLASIAQTTHKVQLLDKNSAEPIISATFIYGDQTGISDLDGIITFEIIENEEMLLSHITYGQKIFTAIELTEIIKKGVFQWEKLIQALYPVTVLALRPIPQEKESLTLNYHDKMAHDGAAVLTQSPTIATIKKSGRYGFDPVLRGFKYDQLNIVMDGVQSATAACPNRMDPPTSQMAPNMMDRIEILKGPYALRFGNGFGGTINFISSGYNFPAENDIYGRISSSYETAGHVFREEALIGFNGNKYDIGVYGSWSQGRDYKDGNGTTVPGEFMRGSIGIKAGFKINNKHQLSVHVNNNLARNADFPALGMDLRKDGTWMLNIGHEANIQKKTLKTWKTNLYGSFVKHLMDNELKDLDPRMMNASTDAKTRTYGGRTEGEWKWDKMIVFAGADLRVEDAEGIREREFLMGPMDGMTLYDNAWQHGVIQKVGMFGEFQYRKKDWHLIASSRIEVNNAKTLDTSEEFALLYTDTKTTEINPSFSIGAVKNFKKSISIGLWMGRSQRSGSLTERYINYFTVGQDPYELIGNPNIEPEVNNQADLTFQIKKGKTVLNIDGFAGYLQNAISSSIDTSLTPRISSSPGVRRYINIDKAFKTGVEVIWLQEWVAGLKHELSMAYTYGQDITRDEPLPEIAPLDMRFSLFGDFFASYLQPRVSVRHVIQQKRISSEYGETISPSFTLLDASIGSKISEAFSVSFGVNNILGTTYYEHLNRSVKDASGLSIYEPGRSFLVSLNLNFM